MDRHPQQAAEAPRSVVDIDVVVVDDHDGFRSVAAEVINATDGFSVRGTAGSWAEAQLLIGEPVPLPKLVLMDVNLGAESGVAAARDLVTTWPQIRVILISTLDRSDLPPNAVTSASGFLPKSRLSPATIRQAWDGAFDWKR